VTSHGIFIIWSSKSNLFLFKFLKLLIRDNALSKEQKKKKNYSNNKNNILKYFFVLENMKKKNHLSNRNTEEDIFFLEIIKDFVFAVSFDAEGVFQALL
jgi:hypothetical protein